MASSLKVNRIVPSTGTNIGFGTANGQIRLASTSKLTFDGDTDTYIWHPSANQLAITRGGASFPIVRIGTGGNGGTIGIGTDGNLVTGGEIISVRGYSSFKSVNSLYAALYTHNEQQGGGGFLGGLLKGLATLGISAFALKYIGPVLLPKLLLLAKTKLIPIIGTALKGGFVKLAALIGKVITGLVAKIPFVGKALAGSALFTGVGAAIIGIGNFISNALSGKGGGGGGAVTGSNVGMTDPTVETGMADTMKEKDLVEGESFSEYRNRTGNVESEENEVKSPPAENKKEVMIERRIKRLKQLEDEYAKEPNGTKRKEVLSRKIDSQKKRLNALGVNTSEITVEGTSLESAQKEVIESEAITPMGDNSTYEDRMNLIEVNEEKRDLSLLDDTNARVDRIVQSTTDAGNIDQNQGVIVPRNTSQTSEATIKLAKSDVKFVQLTANPYISISPTSKGLPPEVLRRLT